MAQTTQTDRCQHDPAMSKYDCCACAYEEAERRIAARRIVAECWTCGMTRVPSMSDLALHWEKWHRRVDMVNPNNPATLIYSEVSTHRAAGHDVRPVNQDDS